MSEQVKMSRCVNPRLMPLLLMSNFVLSGCAHFRESLGLVPKKPKISFADFNVGKASLASIDFEIGLKVLNQDGNDLKIESIDFDLMFTDKIIGSGKSAKPIAMKPNEVQIVKFPISLKTSELLGTALELMKGTSKDKLGIRGTAALETWVGTVDVPFDHKFSQ